MRTRITVLLLIVATLVVPASASAHGRSASVALDYRLKLEAAVIAGAPPPVHPWPIGPGTRYQPPAANAKVLDGRPVGGMRCTKGARFSVHVELFAHRKVIVVPPGIGIARSGCSYPLRTKAPTGVVHVAAARRFTLGDLFTVWGRRLDRSHLVSFHGPVSVFVGGRRRSGDPRRIVLARHAQIVLELGGYVSPHPAYLFSKGDR